MMECSGMLILFLMIYVKGLLAFYGLPLPHTLIQLSTGVPTSLPQGVQYEFQTLPVIATVLVIYFLGTQGVQYELQTLPVIELVLYFIRTHFRLDEVFLN